MEKLSSSFRNSKVFGEWLEKIGWSYRKIYEYFNGEGITKFNDFLEHVDEDENEIGGYTGSRNFHASDNGGRSASQTSKDCGVGNIQEQIFCLDNPAFEPNDKATNINTKNDSDITTKKLDLKHKETNVEVEFKVSYTKYLNNDDTYTYNHRDGNFEKFINDGNIMIVYFINFDRIAVFDKRNFGKSVKIYKKDDVMYGKKFDKIHIWNGLTMEYKMLRKGNSEIGNKVSRLVKYK